MTKSGRCLTARATHSAATIREAVIVWLVAMGIIYVPSYLIVCFAEMEAINPFGSKIGRALFAGAAMSSAIIAILGTVGNAPDSHAEEG